MAGIEARGFIIGGAVAHQLSAGLVPIRKKNKPLSVRSASISALEYGQDRIEIHVDAVAKGERVILVDDLIATGGTAEAAIKPLARPACRWRRPASSSTCRRPAAPTSCAPSTSRFATRVASTAIERRTVMADFTIHIGTRIWSSWSLRPWTALVKTGAAFDEVVTPLRTAATTAAISRLQPVGPGAGAGRLTAAPRRSRCGICSRSANTWPRASLNLARATPARGPWRGRSRPRCIRASGRCAWRCRWTLFASRPGEGLDAEGGAADIQRIDAIFSDCRERSGLTGLICSAALIADAMYGAGREPVSHLSAGAFGRRCRLCRGAARRPGLQGLGREGAEGEVKAVQRVAALTAMALSTRFARGGMLIRPG